MKYFITGLICLFFFSCNDDLRYGNIISVDYHPESDYTTTYFMDMGNGVQLPMTQYWHQAESWSIYVKGIDKNGDSGRAIYFIPKSQWDTMSVGKFICVDGMCEEDSALHKIEK